MAYHLFYTLECVGRSVQITRLVRPYEEGGSMRCGENGLRPPALANVLSRPRVSNMAKKLPPMRVLNDTSFDRLRFTSLFLVGPDTALKLSSDVCGTGYHGWSPLGGAIRLCCEQVARRSFEWPRNYGQQRPRICSGSGHALELQRRVSLSRVPTPFTRFRA